MQSDQPCCNNPNCSDVGKVNQGNVKTFSSKERRYYCTTCRATFSASKDTIFYRLRTPRQDFIEAVGLLAERCSLRAIARIKQTKLDTVSHWLEIAGKQAATVSYRLLQKLRLTQVQIDELWTFVKKSRGTSPLGKSSRVWVTTGSGLLLRSPRGCASPVISARTAAKLRPPPLSSKYGRKVMGLRRSSPVTSCQPRSPL